MTKPSRTALVISALLLAACGDASTGPPARDIEEFAARLEQMRERSHIPGLSVVIAKGQQIVWARGFGYADVAQNRPVTPTTPFHLASLTKTFASTVIMQLVEEGKVSLDDPVSSYGITLPSPGIIRVRHLLTHTSEGEPGTVFRYNGDRFGLLDSVVHHATGQTFAQALEERILARLQLPNTAPNVRSPADFDVTGFDPNAFAANLARGYTIRGSDAILTTYPSYFGTAAGLIASATDMAEYSMAIDRDMFLRPETKALVFTPARSVDGSELPYGLGWFVSRVQGVTVVWHYGLWTANSSLIIKVPDRELTYVVLANADALSSPYDIIGDIRNSPWAREFLDAFVTGSAPLPVASAP